MDAPEILLPRRRIIDPTERRRRVADSKSRQRTRRRLFQYFLDNGSAADDELAFFLDEYLQLQYPRQAACPNHVGPFQILSDLYFDRVRAMLIYASRASGKTLTFAVMNLLDGCFRQEAIDITNAAATRDQSVKCYRYFIGFHRDPLLASLLVKDPTQSYSEDKTGSTVEVVTGSIKGLNSRHPAKSRIDEIELVTYETLKEGLSMSQSKGSVPATDMFASTRKWGGGTMTRLLNEADARGIAVRPHCVYEIVQRCDRQCRGDPVYGDCPIYTRKEIQLDGTIAEVPFCYGRLHDVPGGWLPVDDVIQKGMLLDKETWEVPCEHKKPTALKRVYPKFHEELHTMTLAQFQQLTGFERPPAEWTRVVGLDLGSVFAYGLAAIDPLAAVWHRSESGRQWHCEQMRRVWGEKTPQPYACTHCGRVASSLAPAQSHFCSNACKSAVRRQVGVDNVGRVCMNCGNLFRVNRYKRTQTCSHSCGAFMRWARRKAADATGA